MKHTMPSGTFTETKKHFTVFRLKTDIAYLLSRIK